MVDTRRPSFRQSALAFLLGAATVGGLDAARVVLVERLALGPIAVLALIGAGLVGGVLLSLPWVALLGIGRLRDGGLGPVLFAGQLVAGASLGASAWTTQPPGPWMAVPLAVALVAAGTGGLLARRVPRLSWGIWVAPALVAIAGLAALRPQARVGVAREPDRPSVLLVTVAGLRADHVGRGSPDTSAWDRLAVSGARFDVAMAPSPDPAEGLEALLAPALLDALVDAGLPTAAFLGDPAHGVGSAVFDRYDDDTGWPAGFDRLALAGGLRALGLRASPPRRGADRVVDRAVRHLAAAPGQSFTWVHLVDPEPPYDPPPPYDERYYGGDDPRAGAPTLGARGVLPPSQGAVLGQVVDPRYAEARYDGEVAWTDAQVGRLLDAVDAAGAASTTLVVVAGASGQVQREAEPWFGGRTLVEAAVHVPIVLRLPGRVPVGERLATPVALTDLGPTLLDYLGLETSAVPGTSLRAALEGTGLGRTKVRVADAEGAVAVRARGGFVRRGADGTWRAWSHPGERAEPWTRDAVRALAEEVAGAPVAADVVTSLLEALQGPAPALGLPEPR